MEEERQEKAKRVVVAVDESDSCFYALQWAIDHLESLVTDVGLLTLLHVQQPFPHFIHAAGRPGGAVAIYALPGMLENVRKAQRQNSTVLIARALQICRGKPFKAESLILEGDPKEMICQAVEEMHADLLVIGSRGLGRIRRAFLGSVSDFCAHHAKCPILIAKPPKESGAK